MPMTTDEAYVLANLDRVVARPYNGNALSPTTCYQLDGEDCTQPIKELLAQQLVSRQSDGLLERTGERQRPSPEAFKLLRDSLLQPVSVHRDPDSASAQAAQGNVSIQTDKATA